METCAPATSWHHQHRPLPKTSEASPISAETIRQRDDAYYDQGRRAVERAVHDLCSGASVTLTGSIVHGLHLPAPASDMDLLVQHPAVHPADGLLNLYRRIRADPVFTSAMYIPTASDWPSRTRR